MLNQPWSRREHLIYPEPINGYELDPERGWFSVVVPETTDTVNLIPNPSFEINTTGWVEGTGTIVRSTTEQRRGVCCLEATPDFGEFAVDYQGITTTTGRWYTFSVDIKGHPGTLYGISMYNGDHPSDVVWRSTRGKGYWERISVSFYETSGSASAAVRVEQYNDGATNVPFYIDGAQLEQSNYATTYFDGDTKPIYPSTQSFYSWSGTAHASASIRKARTPGGGKEVNLSDIGFRVIAAVGLGMATITNIATPISTGGALYQRAIPQVREFALAGNVFGEGEEADLQAIRRELVKLVDPLTVPQPITLRYHSYDLCGNDTSEVAQIPCVYQSGLEQNMDNVYQERIGMVFKAYIPFILGDGDTGADLDFQYSIANANHILERSAGIWAGMGTGLGNTAMAIVEGKEGYIYVGGTFTSAGGVANTSRIAFWNGSTWNAMGTGMDGIVYALAVGPDGSIYAGGSFTTAGGVSAPGIAKWDGSTWSALGAGVNNNSVKALVFGSNGKLYAGGSFTQMASVANTAYIAAWDGSNWSALGSGANDWVLTLLYTPSGYLCAGGDFTAMGGVANTGYIAVWNGSAWISMGGGAGGYVGALAYGADGLIYAGGTFSTIGGVSASRVAKWNGTSWAAVGTGLTAAVRALAVGPDNTIYIGGDFRKSGDLDGLAVWTGGNWLPPDVALASSSKVYALAFDRAGRLYVGYDQDSATTALVTVTNQGGALAYPTIVYTGPGTIYQLKNYSTRKSVYFNGLTLLSGERAVLSFSPSIGRTFTSSFRGDLSSYILPGSALDFALVPGSNNLSAFIYGGTDGNTSVGIYWPDYYTSLDHFTRRP